MALQMIDYNESRDMSLMIFTTINVLTIFIISYCACPDEDSSKKEIKSLKRQLEERTLEYNKLVDDFNNLVDQADDIEIENLKNIHDYNNLLDEYNILLDKNSKMESRIDVLESRLRRNINYKCA